MERYLTAPDAAPILNLSTQGVYRLIKRGELPVAAATEAGMYLFRREDVERVAEARSKQTRNRGMLAMLPEAKVTA